MTIGFGLGRFGDRRLEKGGRRCLLPLSNDPVRVFGGLQGDAPRKCGFGAFCAIDQ
jgi:hypothetical protein